MNIQVSNEKQVVYLLNALEALVEVAFTRFDYTMEDVVNIASFHVAIKNQLDEIISRDEKIIPETLKREPNKGERTMLGKPNYVKP